jgi:predicted phosphodiesterase
MRILHCSDFHGHEPWFRWLVASSADYDLVCVTGDHLDLTNFCSIDTQITMVRKAFESLVSPAALVSGNNDSFKAEGSPLWLLHAKWLADLKRTGLWIDGDEFFLKGVRFGCVGWNAPLPAATGSEVWLYHAPPARSPLALDPSGGDVGDELLDERCRAKLGPAMVLAGHQHTPRHWLWCLGHTWILNPGRGTDVHVPNHIVIDTSRRTVALHRTGESVHRVPLGYPA